MLEKLNTRVGIVVAAVTTLMVLGATSAFAAADTAIVDPITTASATFKDTLIAVAVVGLGIGASLYALRRGWRLLKSFVG
jgi:hypothetical protein